MVNRPTYVSTYFSLEIYSLKEQETGTRVVKDFKEPAPLESV